MDHPLRLDRHDLAPRPWRVAVLALAAVAAVELVLLVLAGGALLARADATLPVTATKARATTTAPATSPAKTKAAAKATADAAILARRKVGVVVLNGNGRQGAAAGVAARATGRGYRIRGVANAPSSDYPRSLVMYRPGFAPEGRRLARDLGVPLVSPLDGMRPRQLNGAHVVLILGG